MRCLRCGNILLKKEGRKRINPKRKYCDSVCRSRYTRRKRYHKKEKYDIEYKEKQKGLMKNWYKENKERQCKNTLKNYYQNKKKWLERKYTNRNKQKILKILPNICAECGKDGATIIHHTTYDFPKRKVRKSNKEFQKYLIEYCKKLLLFCSKDCHKKYERKEY